MEKIKSLYSSKEIKIAVIGLGYVGLPLAVEFGKYRHVVGYDINKKRIDELISGIDKTKELTTKEIFDARFVHFTYEISSLRECNFFIITVPTPINEHKNPDTSALESATKMISGILKKGDIVVYESTVYPGATEEMCVPILEKGSQLKFNIDFFCGYSPERINPGDKVHTLTKIKKVTSGSNDKVATIVDNIYSEIITEGTHLASSIKVAEAAKIIENTQRDINIALINELSIIFNKMGLDTNEILDAAETKWNFLPFRPGLVGGHCIGVDPYYLTYKSQEIGYDPEVILAGRKLNDSMGDYVVNVLVGEFKKRKININSQIRVLIMGFTFKENCPDIRNTKVIDIYRGLKKYNFVVDIFDTHADPKESKKEYGIKIEKSFNSNKYNALILAVRHSDFREYMKDIRKLMTNDGIIYDLKNFIDPRISDLRL